MPSKIREILDDLAGAEEVERLLFNEVKTSRLSLEELELIVEIFKNSHTKISPKTLAGIIIDYLSEKNHAKDHERTQEKTIKKKNEDLLKNVIFNREINLIRWKTLPSQNSQENSSTFMQGNFGLDIQDHLPLVIIAERIVKDGIISPQEIQDFAIKASEITGRKVDRKEAEKFLIHFAAVHLNKALEISR